MPYSHTNFGDAKTQLAARLHDSGYVFYTNAELGQYLKESLRVWQLLTGYWRERGVFATTANVAFYDIPTKLPSLRGYTLKDQDLVTDIQYHLLEPPTPTAWTGTEQFTLSDITAALQRRRNQFIGETGCVVSRYVQNTAPPPVGRIPVPDSIVDVRRVAWTTVGGVYSHLWREDEWALNTALPTWNIDYTTPSVYSVSATPPLTIQLGPPPIDAGTLEVLAVQTPTNLNPATGVLMNIPDDFCWIVKWGALADLLSKDGPALDPARAKYCADRYKQGVELARLAPCVVNAEIQGLPTTPVSLFDLDAYAVDWENQTGQPTGVALASINLAALVNPVPDDVYSITFDLVRNAPIPTLDGIQLQLGREELNAILSYAEHLALFKVAGDEWESTLTIMETMLDLASNYNARLSAASRYKEAMARMSKKEEYARPRRKG